MTTSSSCRVLGFAAFALGLSFAAACGGSVRGENAGDLGYASTNGGGSSATDASFGSDARASVTATPSPSAPQGCTAPLGGSGGSSTSGGNGGSGSGQDAGRRDIDLCRGDVGCGVGLFCATPQQCCIAAVAPVDPASCPCGVSPAVVGTHCATSCPTTPQQCFQDPGGRNTDCPTGQQCLHVSTAQVGNVPVVLSTCAPDGSGESGSSSSGGNQGAGSCIDPGAACAGSVFACSSALSCAPGEVCCETTAVTCAACPAPPPCAFNCGVSGSSGG